MHQSSEKPLDGAPTLYEMNDHQGENDQAHDGVISDAGMSEELGRQEYGRGHAGEKPNDQLDVNEPSPSGD
jgi:hypothetical protein